MKFHSISIKSTISLFLLMLSGWLSIPYQAHAYRDLETGVFITRDPAGFVDGPNLYAFVHQNPWTKFDPEGLSEEGPNGQLVRMDAQSGYITVLKGGSDAPNVVFRRATEVSLNDSNPANAERAMAKYAAAIHQTGTEAFAKTTLQEAYNPEASQQKWNMLGLGLLSMMENGGGGMLIQGPPAPRAVAEAPGISNPSGASAMKIAVRSEAQVDSDSAKVLYTPDRRLPRTNHGDPIPDTNTPHSQLGKNRIGEPAAREWIPDGRGGITASRDIEFTDHGTPDIHPNPHQHDLTPNNSTTAPVGGYSRGPAAPLKNP